VIADRGYDSDQLRQRWKRRGIELIAPYRKNNKLRRYENGRKLRRYKRRWIIERTTRGWDSSVACWPVMNISSPSTVLFSILPARVMAIFGIFMKRAPAKCSSHTQIAPNQLAESDWCRGSHFRSCSHIRESFSLQFEKYSSGDSKQVSRPPSGKGLKASFYEQVTFVKGLFLFSLHRAFVSHGL